MYNNNLPSLPMSTSSSTSSIDTLSQGLPSCSLDALLLQLSASIPSLLTTSPPSLLPPPPADPSSLIALFEALPRTVANEISPLPTTPPIHVPTPIKPTPALLSPPLSFHSSLGSSSSNPLPSSSLSLSSNSSIASAFSFLQIPSSEYGLLERRRSAPEGTVVSVAPETVVHEKRRFSDFSSDRQSSSDLHRRRHSIMTSSSIDRKSSNPRKQRTIYACGQTKVLEEAFVSQRYMVGSEREQLAVRLGLTEAQVRVWFQNRRSKHRKQSRASESSTTEPTVSTSATVPVDTVDQFAASLSTGMPLSTVFSTFGLPTPSTSTVSIDDDDITMT